MKNTLSVAILALTSSLSHAGTQIGTIQYVRVRASDGLIYFALNGPPVSAPPSCSRGYWMIRDENSNAGKQQYAMLLAAQLSGKAISIVGNNTCNRWIDGEDADEIRIVD